jgi:hypothetical protein
MAIHRHAPGEPAPIAGRYALVGHYGEPTNFTVRCEAGERFPRMIIAGDRGLFWFVRVYEADEKSRAA